MPDESQASNLPEPIAAPSMRWIASSAVPWHFDADEPLPLIAFDRPCLFHSAAAAALDRAGIKWRVAFTSPSLSGLWAAAAAGLGVTVRTSYGLPFNRSPARYRRRRPARAAVDSALALHRASGKASPLVERLASLAAGIRRAEAHVSSETALA